MEADLYDPSDSERLGRALCHRGQYRCPWGERNENEVTGQGAHGWTKKRVGGWGWSGHTEG